MTNAQAALIVAAIVYRDALDGFAPNPSFIMDKSEEFRLYLEEVSRSEQGTEEVH